MPSGLEKSRMPASDYIESWRLQLGDESLDDHRIDLRTGDVRELVERLARAEARLAAPETDEEDERLVDALVAKALRK